MNLCTLKKETKAKGKKRVHNRKGIISIERRSELKPLFHIFSIDMHEVLGKGLPLIFIRWIIVSSCCLNPCLLRYVFFLSSPSPIFVHRRIELQDTELKKMYNPLIASCIYGEFFWYCSLLFCYRDQNEKKWQVSALFHN